MSPAVDHRDRLTSRPHDALFRAAFEHPEHVAAELRTVLPAAVSAAVDWSSLQREAGSFVGPDLADRHSDLLFSARLGAKKLLVYLLLEHQSGFDPRMPLRMLVYIVRIWERCAAEAPDEPLPIIVPVLVSHADGRPMPTRMRELVEAIPEELAELASLVPEFRILVDDLTRTSSEELRTRSLAQFPKLALWLLRDGRRADALLAGLVEWSEAFHSVAQAPNGIQALVKLLRYLDIVLSEEQYGRFRAKLLELAPNTEEAIMRYGERLIAEGRAEGRAEGVLDGQRAALLKQLRLKFGEVDERVLARVAEASPPDLERWLERILLADRSDDVFAS